MIIKKITHQHRRDFDVNLVCEHCKHTQMLYLINGYSERNLRVNIAPKIPCQSCRKVANGKITNKKDVMRGITP